MRETPDDLRRLRALLDASATRASPFLRASFEIPERSLSAEQLVKHLTGSLTVALATVTAKEEPRVAPINALFYRGSFHIPTVAQAARARHLAKRPGASLTYYEGNELAVIVHGQAAAIPASSPAFDELDAIQTSTGQQSPREWEGDAIYLKITAATMFTYAREGGKV
ncbi:MAG TPA: pyridoxamine 5'-phosphate oxidase family protein [Solirubrobacteraceae bacterium]|nr:pyridoxamine 5'-phosphate oxidase family protein [Solirubrobacteraceae bacterium]